MINHCQEIILVCFLTGKTLEIEIYIFDSDLVCRMQLMIIKVRNSCWVCREFFTFNAY